jgi:hypothetical protein
MGRTPLEDLSAALRGLHRAAGEPSSHEIARKINYSHTTVAQTLRMQRCPSWPVFESVVKCLGGDIEKLRPYWVSARDAEDPLISPHLNDERSGEQGDAPPGPVVLRWKTRLETIEFYDRGLAQQWIRARTLEGNQGE